MTKTIKDPLLLAGKGISIILQGAMAIGAVALIVAIPALVIYREDAAAEFAAEASDPNIALPVMSIVAIMLIGLAIVSMLFLFFGRLRKIIGTVGEGDPFQAANADRLSQMGWLMLGTQLLIIPAAAIGIQLAQFADEAGDLHAGSGDGLDPTGILLVIILFILARVFRHGTAMRDDLEGTV